MNEATVEAITVRCWRYAIEKTPDPVSKREIERHLTLYADLRELIEEGTAQEAFAMLEREADSEKRKVLWKYLMPFANIMGLGSDRMETRVHKDWWHDLQFRGAAN
jgi:hypothetical protein